MYTLHRVLMTQAAEWQNLLCVSQPSPLSSKDCPLACLGEITRILKMIRKLLMAGY